MVMSSYKEFCLWSLQSRSEYPFFTNRGLHYVQCINPVCNISYKHKSLVVHDLKLSAYFRGLDCVSLYDFSSPVLRFNVLNVTESLSSGKPFFDCVARAHMIFLATYSRSCTTSPLAETTPSSTPQARTTWLVRVRPRETSGSTGSFRLAMAATGLISLCNSAGFSRKWTLLPDCFDCGKTWVNYTGSIGAAGEQSSCGCRSERWRARPSKRHYHRWRTILGICAAAGVASFIMGSLYITLWCPSHKREVMGAESEREVMDAEGVQAVIKKHGSLFLRSYTYSDVKKITKSFSEKLGQGGYGTVFKGKLFDGHPVAVKVLSESKGNGEDFINEVATIGQTSHVNVVTLRGFCVQGSKRALIYDFMPNGSLEKYISLENTAAETILRWEKLYEIVIGIARGLEYLHRGCNTRIVHFDIKPHNILLDQDLCPKISDFGMAKLCPGKGSIISMEGARGTIGYIAPEVFSRTFGTVSSKSDVYSYGMVLLEMFGGKRKRSSRLDTASDAYFPNWIYEHIDENDNLTAYGVTSETEDIARKMMIVGFWCIQTKPENRPSMSRVMDMLEGSIKDLSIPPKPCLTSPVDLIVGSCATSST